MPVVIRIVLDLPGVLSPLGFDQPVEGVIGIAITCVDLVVVKEDSGLSIVPDLGDVSARVIGVARSCRSFLSMARRVSR
jgi:hypothetical protein